MIKLIQQFLNWIIGKIFKRKTVIGKNAVEQIMRKKFNFLGSAIRRRGQTLYKYDPLTEEVTGIPILRKEDLTGYRGFIGKNDKLTWAINKKNAERKLFKAYKSNEVLE